MSVTKSLFGTSRSIPETDETAWGSEMTTLIGDQTDVADSLANKTTSNGVFPRWRSATITLAADATLTATAQRMRIAGTSGAVTLSTSTTIIAGEFDGQELMLYGTHETNTVTVPDNGNCKLNGPMVLGEYKILCLIWDDDNESWVEVSRSF